MKVGFLTERCEHCSKLLDIRSRTDGNGKCIVETKCLACPKGRKRAGVCSRCAQRPLPNRRASYCQPCAKESAVESKARHWKKHGGRVKAARNARYATDPEYREKRKQVNRDHAQKNSERLRRVMKAWRFKNAKRLLEIANSDEQRKKWREYSREQRRSRRLEINARQREWKRRQTGFYDRHPELKPAA